MDAALNAVFSYLFERDPYVIRPVINGRIEKMMPSFPNLLRAFSNCQREVDSLIDGEKERIKKAILSNHDRDALCSHLDNFNACFRKHLESMVDSSAWMSRDAISKSLQWVGIDRAQQEMFFAFENPSKVEAQVNRLMYYFRDQGLFDIGAGKDVINEINQLWRLSLHGNHDIVKELRKVNLILRNYINVFVGNWFYVFECMEVEMKTAAAELDEKQIWLVVKSIIANQYKVAMTLACSWYTINKTNGVVLPILILGPALGIPVASWLFHACLRRYVMFKQEAILTHVRKALNSKENFLAEYDNIPSYELEPLPERIMAEVKESSSRWNSLKESCLRSLESIKNEEIREYGEHLIKTTNALRRRQLRFLWKLLRTFSDLTSTYRSALGSQDKIALPSFKEISFYDQPLHDWGYSYTWRSAFEKIRPRIELLEDKDIFNKLETSLWKHLNHFEDKRSEFVREVEIYHLNLAAIANAHNTRVVSIENAPRKFFQISLALAIALLILAHLDQRSIWVWCFKWGFVFVVVVISWVEMSLLRKNPVGSNVERINKKRNTQTERGLTWSELFEPFVFLLAPCP